MFFIPEIIQSKKIPTFIQGRDSIYFSVCISFPFNKPNPDRSHSKNKTYYKTANTSYSFAVYGFLVANILTKSEIESVY